MLKITTLLWLCYSVAFSAPAVDGLLSSGVGYYPIGSNENMVSMIHCKNRTSVYTICTDTKNADSTVAHMCTSDVVGDTSRKSRLTSKTGNHITNAFAFTKHHSFNINECELFISTAISYNATKYVYKLYGEDGLKMLYNAKYIDTTIEQINEKVK